MRENGENVQTYATKKASSKTQLSKGAADRGKGAQDHCEGVADRSKVAVNKGAVDHTVGCLA